MCRYWDTSQQTLCRCVREETGWLSFGYTTDAKGIGFTAVMLVVAGAVIWGFWKWKKNVEFDERA